MHLVETPVTAPDARLLLEHYFASRALGFPPELGVYRVSHPDPASFVPPRGAFFVAVSDGGAPLGCGGIRLLPEADRRRLADSEGDVGRVQAPVYEVKHVWLEPEARGQGWAGTLMAALEDRAQAFGADTLVLDTNASLDGAARLYARRGYTGIPAYNDNPNATNWYRKSLVQPNG
ncbi:PadR family transcriptional regulator [Subtercola sp. Z020]|uniref:GNAT family N-acetyltransferase n=1 Tax=Subtercola sp. Z020 TaxID=2080582 RepID=UPI000CE83DB3|nr:GNAT family N-acetyltransferase [Subtercola sp. Z020]PPF87724.1 PadR family transcriptional regulator [Subtercola sp. Z020]